MKLLFAHDTRFVHFNDQYYSNGLNANVWKRYLSYFAEIVVCGREVKETDENKVKENLSSTEGVSFECVPNKNAIAIWFDKTDRKHIDSLVKEADAIIARLDSIVGFLAVKYAIKHRKPYMIELVTDPWDCYINYGIKGKVLAPIITYATKYYVKHAPYLVYVTNKYLQDKYPTDGIWTNISNVECTPDISVYNERIASYSQFKVDSTIKIGTAGALLPFKGQRYVIEALGKLHSEGKDNYEYLLAGKGSDEDTLKKLAESLGVADKIKFLGSFTKPQMEEFYKSLTVYVQPSLQEGLPRSVIEAMSHGLYCIGSRTAGTPELLPEECVVPQKNSLEIYKRLKDVNKEMLLSYCKINFEESKKYDKEVLFDRRKDFLTTIFSK